MTTTIDTTRGSPDRFGYEWGEYDEIRPEYETQFLKWTPFMRPEDWKDVSFIDVGCGMGRNSYWPLEYGAAKSFSIDVDDRTLASAKRTLARFPHATVQKASAYDIPHVDTFDVAFSIGVIHHLEFPDLALAAMTKSVKPGGRVMIWVYGYENNEWIVKFFDPFRKAIFSRLPIKVVHHLSIYPTFLLYWALRLGLAQIAYFRLIRTFTFRHLRSIVFDQMLPKIAHYWPRETVIEMLQRQGLSDVRVEWVNEMSWTAIGTKPT